MSDQITRIDTETAMGAVRAEAHWLLVTASTGGGLTYTWLGHLLDWTPLGFAVHGVAGLAGGYLVGTGLARLATGARVRPIARTYERVPSVKRFTSSFLRLVFGTAFFAASYQFALGHSGVEVATAALSLSASLLPLAIWGVILFFAITRGLIRAAR